jgi:hypothetical protein
MLYLANGTRIENGRTWHYCGLTVEAATEEEARERVLSAHGFEQGSTVDGLRVTSRPSDMTLATARMREIARTLR